MSPAPLLTPRVPRPSGGRPRRRFAGRSAACLALLLLAACGESDVDRLRKAAPDPDSVAAPTLPPIPLLDRARYARDRLERGPIPMHRIRVPRILDRTLTGAGLDLAAMPEEAVEVLSDPALIAATTDPARRKGDFWLAALTVLAQLPRKPADLVIRWCEPALEMSDTQLRRRAVSCLATVGDPAVAPLLLEYLAANARDREIGPLALASLVALGGPWRSDALEAVVVAGAPLLWLRVSGMLSGDTRIDLPYAYAPVEPALLAGWALRAEIGRPRPSPELPRTKGFEWAEQRRLLDARIPTVGAGARRSFAEGPWSAAVAHASGWFTCEIHDQPAQAPHVLMANGREPAADARCALALQEHEPFLRARDHDRTLKAFDGMRYHTARHCVERDEVREQREANLEHIQEIRERALAGEAIMPADLFLLLGGLPDASRDEEAKELLFWAMRDLAPLDRFRAPVEAAYTALGVVRDERDAVLIDDFENGVPARRARALSLMRRFPDAAWIDTLSRSLEGSEDREGRELRSLLLQIVATIADVPPKKRTRFIDDYAAWIAASDDRTVATTAAALLDLGERGEAHLIEGMRGDRAHLYLEALLERAAPLSPTLARVVAAAGLDMDEARRMDIVALAYSAFPPEAAGSLVPLRDGLPTEAQKDLDTVIERVRHRAPTRR